MTSGKICPPLTGVGWCSSPQATPAVCGHDPRATWIHAHDTVEVHEANDLPPDPLTLPKERLVPRTIEPLEVTEDREIEPPILDRVELYSVVIPSGSLIDIFM